MPLVQDVAAQPNNTAPLQGTGQSIAQGLDAGVAFAAAQQKSDLMGQQLDDLKQQHELKLNDYTLDALDKASKAKNPQVRNLILNSLDESRQKLGQMPLDPTTKKYLATDDGAQNLEGLVKIYPDFARDPEQRLQFAKKLATALDQPLTDAMKTAQELAESYTKIKNQDQQNDFKNTALDIKQSAQDVRSAQLDDKSKEKQEKVYTELSNKLNTFRGDNAAQQANKNLLAADNALAILKGKDLNSLTKQEVQLFYGELAKISTGGVPTGHGMQELVPSNLASGITTLISKGASVPVGAQQGEFLKKGLSYLNDLRSNSQEMVDKYRANTIKGYYRRLSDEQKEDLITDHPEVARFLPGYTNPAKPAATQPKTFSQLIKDGSSLEDINNLRIKQNLKPIIQAQYDQIKAGK